MAGKLDFDSTVFVFAITAMAYACGFAFEVAYLKYFGVPQEFVQIDVRSVLYAGASISMFLAVYHLAEPSPLYWGKVFQEYRCAWGQPIVMIVVMGAIAWLIGFNESWRVLLAFLAIPVVQLITNTLVAVGQQGTFRERLAAGQRKREIDPAQTVTGLVMQRFGLNPSALAFGATAAVAVVVVAYGLGQFWAHRRSDFHVVAGASGQQPCAILTTYGSTAICMTFDASKRVMQGDIRTFELSGKELLIQRVGPFEKFTYQPL